MNTPKPLEHLVGLKWVGKLSLEDADILAKLGRQASSILEFGCGGSTLIFSQVCNGIIHSVEEHKAWSDLTQERLKKLGTDHKVTLIDYQNYPEKLLRKYDLMFVDGTTDKRPVFTLKNFNRVKPGGYILYHDINRDVYRKNVYAVIEHFYRSLDNIDIFCLASNDKPSNLACLRVRDKLEDEHVLRWRHYEGRPLWSYSLLNRDGSKFSTSLDLWEYKP